MAARWIEAKKTKLRRAYMKRPKPIPAHGWSKPYRDAVSSTERGIPLPHIVGCTEPVRERTLVIHKLWQSDTDQGLETWLHIDLRNGKLSKLSMYFSGTKFFFLKVNYITRRAIKSVMYRSRSFAMFAYEQGAIDWVEEMSLDDV